MLIEQSSGDDTKQKNYRRLDSLAKIFEGGSTCAAVSNVSLKLLVTSNNTTPKQLEYMNSVKTFLFDITNGSISHKEADTLNIPIEIVKSYFKSNERFSIAAIKKKGVDDDVLEEICKDVLNKENLKPASGRKKLKLSKPTFNYTPSQELLEKYLWMKKP